MDPLKEKTAEKRLIYISEKQHTGDFLPFQHRTWEMAVPVTATELTPQQLGYLERESAHTSELWSINPLKDNRRRVMEKKLLYSLQLLYC